MAGQIEDNLEMDGYWRWTLVRVGDGIKDVRREYVVDTSGAFFNRRTWAGVE
jgi:hypothetical protein